MQKNDNTPRPELFVDFPKHGYRGDLFPDTLPSSFPGHCLCISRQFGARGGSIAAKVAKKLGWQIYSHEILQYMASNPAAKQELFDFAGSKIVDWVEGQWSQLVDQRRITRTEEIEDLARVILLLGCIGNTVFVGSGAGFLVPDLNRLHTRIIAPFDDRASYISQYDRLTLDDSKDKVRNSDERRVEFLHNHFKTVMDEPYCYDLILNSSRLGEECTVQTIIQATRIRYGF
jgi:cytidylate kinase